MIIFWSYVCVVLKKARIVYVIFFIKHDNLLRTDMLVKNTAALRGGGFLLVKQFYVKFQNCSLLTNKQTNNC